MKQERLSAYQEAAIQDFKARYVEKANHFGIQPDEERCEDFVKLILSDDLLVVYFLLTYPKIYTHEHVDFINSKLGHSPIYLSDKLYELRGKWSPYLDIFEVDLFRIWLTTKKINAGDKRPIDKIYREGIPKKHEVKSEGAITYYTIFRQEPAFPNVILKNTKYDRPESEKWIGEIHFFGVDDETQTLSQNENHGLMLKRFSADWQIFPNSTQSEYLVHYHHESLSPESTREYIEKRCNNSRGETFAWGPKYINLIHNWLLATYKNRGEELCWEPLKPDQQIPSKYPEKYWVYVEYPDEARQIVSYHFLATIKELPKCQSIEAIPAFLKTTLLRKIIQEHKKQSKEVEKKEGRLGKEPIMMSLECSIRDSDGDKIGETGANVAGTLLPTIKPLDIDFLFPNPQENFVVKHLTWKSKDLAAELGVGSSRARQIRTKVKETMKEYCKRIEYLGTYIPGPFVDINRINALRYRKPDYQYSDLLTKRSVSRREKRADELASKYPVLHKKL